MIFIVICVTGCSNLGYYWQNTQGHLAVMNAAKPVQEWLDDAQTPDAIKRRLALSQRIREFASRELALPSNASYRRYADLKRNAVVWNVVAAPLFSLQLKTWCFAAVGCVGYRGYYNEADAKLEAERVKAEGFEVNVYGVPAYSTLGYMNWAGGDPLLSTFIGYPEGELARMIFHELAHQVLYVKDDTMFNESFATAVERLGGQQWLAQNGSEAARKEYEAFDSKRREFRTLTLRTRERLAQVYKQNTAIAGKESAQSATESIANQKLQVMQQLRDEYAQLKTSWSGFAGYDRFIANANNASLGAQAAYDELVPQFEAVFEKKGKNWKEFYQAIQSITPLPKDERRKALLAMTQ
ncbi:aminopeptidase [Variovorax sp. PCZ-1]|uniref:aminopeptidase n=1 Tax=Variovorax sp. PCZ-1 TaxID=2835533 RepID=UPI0020BDF91A|nr:aminopeptidase [Variovorax sp. PCZ-1]